MKKNIMIVIAVAAVILIVGGSVKIISDNKSADNGKETASVTETAKDGDKITNETTNETRKTSTDPGETDSEGNANVNNGNGDNSADDIFHDGVTDKSEEATTKKSKSKNDKSEKSTKPGNPNSDAGWSDFY